MPSTHLSLSYHLVFSTRNREPVILGSLRSRLHEMLGGSIRTAGGVSLRVGGTADHVHLLVGLKAKYAVADVLRDIKRATSEWVHDVIGLRCFAWQEGYGAFTVSPRDCAGVIRYIDGQEEHHRVRTFQEEYRAFLEDYGIEFDARYLW